MAEDQGPHSEGPESPGLIWPSLGPARWQKWAYVEVQNLARFVDLASENLWNHQSLWLTPMMTSNYVWLRSLLLVEKPWQSQSATTVKQGRQQTLWQIDRKLPGGPMKWLCKRARHRNQKEHTLSATTLWAQAWVGWPSRMENMRCTFFNNAWKFPRWAQSVLRLQDEYG